MYKDSSPEKTSFNGKNMQQNRKRRMYKHNAIKPKEPVIKGEESSSIALQYSGGLQYLIKLVVYNSGGLQFLKLNYNF